MQGSCTFFPHSNPVAYVTCLRIFVNTVSEGSLKGFPLFLGVVSTSLVCVGDEVKQRCFLQAAYRTSLERWLVFVDSISGPVFFSSHDEWYFARRVPASPSLRVRRWNRRKTSFHCWRHIISLLENRWICFPSLSLTALCHKKLEVPRLLSRFYKAWMVPSWQWFVVASSA